MRVEAEQLSVCREQDSDEWWNGTLELAKHLEDLAVMFSDAGSGYLDVESVLARARSHMDHLSACDVDEIVGERIAIGGLPGGSLAPAGAWALLLGLAWVRFSATKYENHCRESGVGTVGGDAGDVDDDDDDGEKSCVSAELL